MSGSLAIFAAFIGFFAALSLPLGSLLGLTVKPGVKVTSAFMAFGGGALLFALTIEIIAHSFHVAGFWPVALGAVAGGLLYEILSHGLDKIGAFFRKTTTVNRFVSAFKRKRAKEIIEHLSRSDILSALPPEEIARIVPSVYEVRFAPAEVIFEEQSPGDSLYMIDTGKVSVTRGGEHVSDLSEGKVFGEMSMVTGALRSATVRAVEETVAFKMYKADFDKVLAMSPDVRLAVHKLLDERSKDLANKKLLAEDVALRWKKETSKYLENMDFRATAHDIGEAARSHGDAALGIWLGNLLDGIPESLVIGISISAKTDIPWPLFAGVFLANLPEAMSSSVLMKQQKYSFKKIMIMWSSIAIMAGFCAFAGNMFFRDIPHYWMAVIEGVAAGAMLTMIAETMLPEAFEQGGAIVGLSTLAGFLAALFIKSLS